MVFNTLWSGKVVTAFGETFSLPRVRPRIGRLDS